jgi:hypothetical protein
MHHHRPNHPPAQPGVAIGGAGALARMDSCGPANGRARFGGGHRPPAAGTRVAHGKASVGAGKHEVVMQAQAGRGQWVGVGIPAGCGCGGGGDPVVATLRFSTTG